MKKIFMSIIFMIVLTSQLFAQELITIKGTLKGNIGDTTKIYLYQGSLRDSTEIKNGAFTFSVPYKEDGVITIVPDYMFKRKVPFRHAMIIADVPGTYGLTIDSGKKLGDATVAGSKTNTDYRGYLEQKKEVFKRITDLMTQGGKTVDYNDPRTMEKRDSLVSLYFFPFLERMVTTNAKNYLSAFILYAESSENMPLEQKKKLYGSLAPAIKKTAVARDFYANVRGIENSAVDKMVVNFTLKTPEGTDLSFSDLKGKYRIIDFWASWCIPCRRSFPYIRKLYGELKSDQFEILSISVDQSKEAWLKAVTEENNPWPQVLDTANINKSGFAVTAIPTMYLISPEGKILMKEIGFEGGGNSSIEKKLRELLKK